MARPYADADADALWALKHGFETELGERTGDDGKQSAYEAKLDADYRDRWLDWVQRCVAEDERCVQVIEAGGDGPTVERDRAEDAAGTDHGLTGYVFVLPESLAFVWDAAVLNEIYVRPEYRGSGVADDLVKAAVAVARDQTLPLDRLVLDVDRENERARAFYERHGFEHWGEMIAREL